MQKVKIKQKEKENFIFLVKTWRKDTVDPLKEEEPVKGGRSALVCFCVFDSTGRKIPCADPVTLRKAKESKAFWNLQIKMWAEDMAKHLLFDDEIEEYTRGFPEWIKKATVNQALRMNPRAGKHAYLTKIEQQLILDRMEREIQKRREESEERKLRLEKLDRRKKEYEQSFANCV